MDGIKMPKRILNLKTCGSSDEPHEFRRNNNDESITVENTIDKILFYGY